MIAIGYTRISKKGDDKTISLDAQADQIRQYCDRQGFDLVHVLRDDGISGGRRSRFARLDDAVKEFRPSCVVYYHQDRIARDVGLGDYFKTLAKRGIEVHEAAGLGKIEIHRAIGRYIVNLRSAGDQAYREIIGEKTMEALALKRQNGKRYSNIPPLGWTYDGGFLVEHPEEQRALNILGDLAQNGIGARRALKRLQESGYTGRQSLTVIHKAIWRGKL